MSLFDYTKNIEALPARRFAIGVLMMGLNAGITLFYLGFVDDGYITYTQAFFVLVPVILLLAVHFTKSIVWYYKKEQHFNFLDLLRFLMLIFSIVLFGFNVFMWIWLIKAA